MPLMGSLYIGTSGLQTSQNALNTTAHNLSNVDTTGFTRQQVQQSSRSYVTIATAPHSIANQQYGLGVNYSMVKQVRDYFLDKSYRKESGRSMFYEVSTNVMEEVENQLRELHGEAFQNTMADFWTSIQELAKDPSSTVNQGMLVQRASEFVDRAVAVYDGLCSYQDNLNLQIKQQVEKINDYGQRIMELNDQIRKIEAGGIEHPNDLRDERNMILDELAKLTSISYAEDSFGAVSVQIEGVDFVKGSTVYSIDLQMDASTGFYTPFWPQNAAYTIQSDGTKKYNIDGAEVFDLEREISTDYNTDIGGLKAMLLARGDHRADYTDISDGSYDDISQSILMNVQGEFDQMIHNIVNSVNSILREAAGVQTGDLVLENGEPLTGVQYCEVDVGGYLRGETGIPLQLFDKVTTDSGEIVTGADGKQYWVYNEENPEEQDSLYTLKNLQVNSELRQNPGRLGFRTADKRADYDTAEKLKAAFTEEEYTLNPNVRKKTTFMDYYNDLVAQVANSGMVYQGIYENQVTTVEATESAREQVVGVSSDEELANMIKFQNAFNASSRYINVISEMLEHIITTLGR